MSNLLIATCCPYCQLPMQTESMSCGACGVRVEGNFRESVFNKLSSEDEHFLEQYLLAGFSIKTLEQNSPLGYAAIRSRLDRLIENYKSIGEMESQKRVVLERLRKGEISVSHAKKRLERISGGS